MFIVIKNIVDSIIVIKVKFVIKFSIEPAIKFAIEFAIESAIKFAILLLFYAYCYQRHGRFYYCYQSEINVKVIDSTL